MMRLLFIFVFSLSFANSAITRVYPSKNYYASVQRSRPENIFSINVQNKNVQQNIVNTHNYYRKVVQPPAANMLKMYWDEEAARTAQAWANRCVYMQHDPPRNRYVQNYGNCGQNICVSSRRIPWDLASKYWFAEYKNFTYGSSRNNVYAVGHYTQMVWATSHKVGCGITWCPYGGPTGSFYNYVCNYCPAGNHPKKLGVPYKTGPACSRCTLACDDELCTNYCPYADRWSSCKRLIKMFGEPWVCASFTYDGLKRQQSCAATCFCKRQIHEWR